MVEFAFALLGAREDAHDLVAVDERAVFVDCEAAVRVSIERDAEVGVGRLDHRLQLLGVCRSRVLVDVVSVR